MASVNKVILVGNLTKDPEQRFMSNGDCVTNVTVATSQQLKDQNGEKKEKSEFHRVTFYRKLAEIAGQYLRKGSQAYVEGRIETKQWTDKNGVERYTTKIIATEMKMLGSKGGSVSQYADSPAANRSTRARSASGFDDMEDDIPFN